MKRQKQVARELARMMAKSLANARFMMEYVTQQPGYEKLLDIHRKHTFKSVDGLMGRMKDVVVPIMIGISDNDRYLHYCIFLFLVLNFRI